MLHTHQAGLGTGVDANVVLCFPPFKTSSFAPAVSVLTHSNELDVMLLKSEMMSRLKGKH